MTIDLSNPIVIGVSISIISAAILGIVHYGRTLAQLDFTNKKLSNVLSELDALHKNYKQDVADIKKRHGNDLTKAVEHALNVYDEKMDKFIEHNKTPRGFIYGDSVAELAQKTEKLESKLPPVDIKRGKFLEEE
jgi:hypothetical protein